MKPTGLFHSLLLLLSTLLQPFTGSPQKVTRINLVSANSMEYKKSIGPDLRRVIGDVVFEHEGANLYCDSAWFYESRNSLDAFGRVRIQINDTLNLYGNLLKYNGDTRLAEISGKVRLIDPQTTLLTDQLFYNRSLQMAYYQKHGKIINKDNHLTSVKGYYLTSSKMFSFKDSVLLTNPKYTMRCDTLLYNTVTRVAFFTGPTTISGKDNFIYCENGWYNTRTDISQFQRNAYIRNNEQILKGDSLYYDRTQGIGRAYHHVDMSDPVRKIIIRGEVGYYDKTLGFSFVTDRVLGIMIEKEDSLYLHADTLFAYFDTLQQTRMLKAYYKAKFFRKDLQGMCDSLIYSSIDSTISLYRQPVLWSEENQLTADSIRLWLKNKVADTMMLYNSAFIISKADTVHFNQIKGRNMTGYFSDNQLYKVKVLGNAQTIYFAREEDGSSIGINTAASSDMVISLKDKKIHKIKYLTQPEAILYPEKEIPSQELELKGFKWFQKKRPLQAGDIFLW